MKRTILFIAASIFYLTAIAQTTTFNYTGALQTYTVPPGVTLINVEARGAQGGSITIACPATGGLGARMQGDIAVTPGEVLTILVGGQGQTQGEDGGGGGGSFVVRTGNIPLVIAGGGGGATNNIQICTGLRNGVDASITTSGTPSANGLVAGGTAGNGGGANVGSGCGGGGFYTDGGYAANMNGRGRAYVNGGAGGTGQNNNHGGYGGGGCGWYNGGNGGGGGGYSGGGTDGNYPSTYFGGGGGGGSYNIGTNQINTAGFQTGNGQVIITVLTMANEINVVGNGNSIANGDITPDVNDFTDFGNILTCTGTISKTYTIENTGNQALNLTGIPMVSISGTNAADFTVTAMPVSPVGVSGSTTFTISFNPSGNGLRSATVTIANDDTDEGTYTFNIQGTGDADVSAPAAPSLSNLNDECSVTPATPTAIDNCAGTVNGTTSTTFPITAQGTTVVTWTFDDGNGNTSTATQNVIIDDVTDPATPTLSDATGECSITVTAPTTTDACAGVITGTTSTSFPISTQGTTVVTWTFDDGHGNVTTANQNVIVDDITDPATPTLSDVTNECSATPAVPTTTDNCGGTITGTTSTSFPITSPGTTVVTWTFDDGNGNTTTANQNIIIDDITNPVADVAVIPAITSCAAVTISSPPTATDNCSGPITGTTSDPLTYSTIGNYTVTWTYTDTDGNSSTQTQSVNILDCSGVEEQTNLQVNIYPNPNNGIFSIGFDMIPDGNNQIRIMDALGQVVYSNLLVTNNMSFDLSHLQPATYFLQVMTDEGKISVKKFIIK